MTLSELVELETAFVDYRATLGYPREETLKEVDKRVLHLFTYHFEEGNYGKRKIFKATTNRTR